MTSFFTKFICIGILACMFCLPGYKGCARPVTNPEDTIRRFNPRLVVLLTDTSEGGRQARTELFYQQLKNRFYRRDLTRRLFDLVFDDPGTAPRTRKGVNQDVMEYFEQYQGRRIQEIVFKKLPLFGPNVNDTTRQPNKWYERAGNRIHTSTRDWVLEKHLIFEVGELVDPDRLYDNERLLRALSYIRDARIRIEPVADSTDAVIIHVITQDVFPLSFGGGRGPFSSYTLSIQNNNIFGIGHRLNTEGVYHRDGSPAMGYAGSYMVENVKGTFINASLSGAYTDIRRGVGLSLQRTFFTPNIRWAGGLDLQRTDQLDYVLHRDFNRDTLVWYANDRIDLWAAHSLPLNPDQPHPRGRDALVFSGRALRIFHHKTPGGELQDNDFFLNRTLWLGSFGWVRRNYRRDAFIYGFGRTEDVPLGAFAAVTYGAEQQEDLMYYGQVSGGWGGYREGFGYLDARLAMGQYFGIGEAMSRRVRYGSVGWISQLIPAGRYRFRQLLGLSYMYGDRRYSYEFISAGNQQVRGIPYVPLRGTQRLAVSFETIAFLPIDLVGFRLATFAFADAALLNDSPYLSFSGEVLQGYGLGLRVRNENLVFKTFQLRAAYYPGPFGGFSLTLKGSPSSGFQEFQLGRPEVYPFR